MTGTTRDRLANAVIELAIQLRGTLELHRHVLKRDADRYPDIPPHVRLELVRDFANERLEAVDVESRPVTVVEVHQAYIDWCDTRRLRSDETLPFSALETTLGTLGFTRTDHPVRLPDGRLVYALERTRLRHIGG